MHAEQFPKNRRVHPRSSGVQASILHLLLLRSSAISTPAASGEPSVHDSSPVRNPERLGETNLDPRLCGFYAYRSFNAIDVYAYFATPAVTQQISFHASTVTLELLLSAKCLSGSSCPLQSEYGSLQDALKVSETSS